MHLGRMAALAFVLMAPVISSHEFHSSDRRLRIPVITSSELTSAGSTRIYLTAFQSYVISVVDPVSGHSVHEIDVQSQQAGIAVSPDGSRLYVLDGRDYDGGFLRVFDTVSWQMIFEAIVAKRAVPKFSNPLSLSGEGRWLLVQHYGYDSQGAGTSVFDTSELKFRAGLPMGHPYPGLRYMQIAGGPGHPRIYMDTGGVVEAFRSSDFEPLWQSRTPESRQPGLVISPKNPAVLYGLHPEVVTATRGGRIQVKTMSLMLTAWNSATGQVSQQVDLTQKVEVPPATIGRGARGYLTISPDGKTLYVSWENRFWAMSSRSFTLQKELALPFAVDGMALSSDGTELYLLPTTAAIRNPTLGLWTVGTDTFQILRHAKDWPRLRGPFMFSAPVPDRPTRAN